MGTLNRTGWHLLWGVMWKFGTLMIVIDIADFSKILAGIVGLLIWELLKD